MRDVLIVGSAPYIRDWWAEWGGHLRSSRVEIHAMNNSIRVLLGDASFWHVSEDLFELFPDLRFVNHSAIKIGFDGVETRSTRPLGFPYSYELNSQSGTTLLNTIQHVINYEEMAGVEPYRLLFIGCDLRYDYGGPSHFYPGGVPDPMRLGAEFLKRNLSYFNSRILQSGNSAINLSADLRTLLPFTQSSVETLKVAPRDDTLPCPPFVTPQCIEAFVGNMSIVCASDEGDSARQFLEACGVGFARESALWQLSQAFYLIHCENCKDAILLLERIPAPAWNWLIEKIFNRNGAECRALFIAALKEIVRRNVSISEYSRTYEDIQVSFRVNHLAAFIHFAFTGFPVEGRSIGLTG